MREYEEGGEGARTSRGGDLGQLRAEEPADTEDYRQGRLTRCSRSLSYSIVREGCLSPEFRLLGSAE
jgi:hypothetical protein